MTIFQLITKQTNVLLCTLWLAWAANVQAQQQTMRMADLPILPTVSMQQLASTAVPSPFAIPDTMHGRTIRYRIALKDASQTLTLPNTAEQRVVPTQHGRPAHIAVLEVCPLARDSSSESACGAEAKPSLKELAAALQPNVWVNSDDYAIRNLANQFKARRFSATRDFFQDKPQAIRAVMTKLVDATILHFKAIDYSTQQTASEAMRSGRGDCGESALLLAALAKSRRIPTRVVHGLAYSNHFLGRSTVFAPHVWVQVWNGQHWESFDAALREFSSTHIALGISNGELAQAIAPAKLRAQIVIETAGVLPR